MDFHRLFILSSRAGNGNVSYLKNMIRQVYQGSGLSYEMIETIHKDHAKELAKAFADKYEDKGIVYVCGGDGTLGEVTSVLAHTKTAMGLIPYGTANDFSKSLYGKVDLMEPLEQSLKPNIVDADAIELQFIEETTKEAVSTYSINIASFGIDGKVLVNVYEMLKKFPLVGKYAYYLAVSKSLIPLVSSTYEMTLSFEGRNVAKLKAPYLLAAFCNGSFYGNGYHPVPKNDFTDGKMDVCTIGKIPLFKLIPLILKYRKAEHIHSKYVHLYHECDHAHIRCVDDIILGNYDGTLFRTKEVEITLHKHCLRLAK